MKCNMGNSDRTLRAILGLVVIAVGYYYQSWWGALGLIPLLTSVFRFCPVYVPFKFTSDKKKKE